MDPLRPAVGVSNRRQARRRVAAQAATPSIDASASRAGGRGRGRRGPHRRGSAGFVLAETLVAFAVMAVGLGLIVTGMAVALRSDGRAAATRAALRAAEAHLAGAGLIEPLAVADLSGTEPGGGRWRMSVARALPEPAARHPPDGAGPQPPPPPLAAFWVDVTVSMPDGAEARLAALKLAPAK